jgi:hypothetical protein
VGLETRTAGDRVVSPIILSGFILLVLKMKVKERGRNKKKLQGELRFSDS